MLKIECVTRMGRALEGNISVGKVALQYILNYLFIYMLCISKKHKRNCLHAINEPLVHAIFPPLFYINCVKMFIDSFMLVYDLIF